MKSKNLFILFIVAFLFICFANAQDNGISKDTTLDIEKKKRIIKISTKKEMMKVMMKMKAKILNYLQENFMEN